VECGREYHSTPLGSNATNDSLPNREHRQHELHCRLQHFIHTTAAQRGDEKLSGGGSGEKRKKKTKKRVVVNCTTNGAGVGGSEREALLSGEERKEATREPRLVV